MNLADRPSNDECFDYHRDYVALVPDGNIVETLTHQSDEIAKFIAAIPADQMQVVHDPYKWAVHTVLEHCCDAERVFGYRLLRFAAGDKTDLPGWDEVEYAACGYGNQLAPEQLKTEMLSLRTANMQLLSRFTENAWKGRGTADGRVVSVRTLAWLMAGHWIHHRKILQKRLRLG